MNRRAVLIGLGSILALIAASWYLLGLRGGSVIIDVIPSDARIHSENKDFEVGRKIRLSRGSHTLLVKSSGFKDRSITVNVRPGSDEGIETFLEPSSDEGRAKLEALGEVFDYEARSGQEIDALARRALDKNPLIEKLPHIEDHFRVDYGASGKSSAPDAIAIYITGDRNAALAWIRSEGFNPADLETIYR